jgi:hypothetical protein
MNSLMRLHVIKSLLQKGMRRLYGYVALGGNRTKLMTKLGYEFLARPDADPDLASAFQWGIAWLNLTTQDGRALKLLESTLGEPAAEFPWMGPQLLSKWPTAGANTFHSSRSRMLVLE